MNIRIERWKSEDNQEEIHFFNGNTYLFGVNPNYFHKNYIQEILEEVQIELVHEDFG